jgi:hypothetical protein
MPIRPDLLKGYTFSGNLVVTCSDERFVTATLEFLKKDLSIDPFDLMAVAGGPAFLLQREPNLVERFDLLCDVHHIRAIFLFSHQDCGYYRSRNPGISSEELEEKILADLRELKGFPFKNNARVRLFYTYTDGKEVFFREVNHRR